MGFWHRIPVIADLVTCTVGAVLYVKMARSALLVKQDPLAMVFFGGGVHPGPASFLEIADCGANRTRNRKRIRMIQMSF